MSHPDEEELVALAMGEPPDAELQQHVAGCARCRDEVASTTSVLRSFDRLGGQAPVLERPHPRVWEAITAELASGVDGGGGEDDGDHGEVASASHRPGHRADVVPIRSRRRLVVGALAGFAVGVAATVAVVALVDGPDPAPAEPVPVATGQLRPLDGQSARGSARLYDGAGVRRLHIDLSDVGDGDGFVEAWLFKPGTTQMVSLGVLDQGSQSFAIPAGLDLAAYRAVDISLEPFDGDPAHSATSLARGKLRSGSPTA